MICDYCKLNRHELCLGKGCPCNWCAVLTKPEPVVRAEDFVTVFDTDSESWKSL